MYVHGIISKKFCFFFLTIFGIKFSRIYEWFWENVTLLKFIWEQGWFYNVVIYFKDSYHFIMSEKGNTYLNHIIYFLSTEKLFYENVWNIQCVLNL